jgi:hypothetical protein
MNLEWQNAEKITKWIPIEKCRDGYLYFIAARNAKIGIYRANKQYFEIRRQKGSEVYRFCGEFHWDWEGGEILFGKKMLGTAKPLMEIEQAPSFKSEKEFICYMENVLSNYKRIKTT